MRLDTTGWARWSTENSARNLNLTNRTNGICTTQNLSLENETQKNSLGFWNTNGSPNRDQTTRPNDSQQQKRTRWIVGFVVLADHRANLKEREKKRSKYLDLAKELKKSWKMKVTVIPIVIGAFGNDTKGLVQKLESLEIWGQVETIQTTALVRSVRILRRVLESWGDLLSFKWVLDFDLWRCPWCNGYRRRIWTRRHEFKSWTSLIAFHIALIPLGMVWIQIFSLKLWVNSRAD